MNLYQKVWDKFLPVIAMKLKSALRKQETEYLVIDQVDFEKAGYRKKQNYQFHLEMNEGRVLKSNKTSTVGIDFARAMKEYPPVYDIIKNGIFVFTFNSKFVLSIESKAANVQEAAPPADTMEKL